MWNKGVEEGRRMLVLDKYVKQNEATRNIAERAKSEKERMYFEATIEQREEGKNAFEFSATERANKVKACTTSLGFAMNSFRAKTRDRGLKMKADHVAASKAAELQRKNAMDHLYGGEMSDCSRARAAVAAKKRNQQSRGLCALTQRPSTKQGSSRAMPSMPPLLTAKQCFDASKPYKTWQEGLLTSVDLERLADVRSEMAFLSRSSLTTPGLGGGITPHPGTAK